MNKKSNPSKNALEELFSNGTDEIGVESRINKEPDRREELKRTFFGLSSEDSTSFKNTDMPVDKTDDTAVAIGLSANNISNVKRREPKSRVVSNVTQHTGVIPKVQQHTVTIPKVQQHTGTISKAHQHTGTILKEQQHTGTIPKVQQHACAIPETPVAEKKIPKSSTKRKSAVWLISVIGAFLICVCAVTAFIYIKEKNRFVPADLVCSIGSMVSDGAEEQAKSAVLSPTQERYKVTFTFFEKPDIVCTTTKTTVGDLIGLLGIEIDEMKRLSHSRTDEISEDCTVDIKTLSYSEAKTTEAIPFETEYADVQTIPKGTTSVYRAGVNGVKTYTYKCLLVNGEEESRELVKESVTSNPTTQIVYRGIGGTVTSQGQTYSFSYYIDVSATTYHIVGTTASGLPTSESVMAVDPRVIRLGTECVVKGSYGDFGYRIAADTGGSIKGNKIDIWLPQDSYYAGGFGWRAMRVYILN